MKANRTIDHGEIRKWAESRGGRPSRVRETSHGKADHGKADGVLRFDFGEPDEKLEQISWEDFFRVFEDRELALIYQEETEDGKKSRFSKLVSRSAEDE